MDSPVQERLIAISYEALDQDVCLDLQRLLHKTLVEGGNPQWELVQSISSPHITMPEESARSEAPDWSKMKLFVDRCYRYQRTDKKVLVQFCKNFMTINVAAKADEGISCPAFDVLVEAFHDLLPFVRDTLITRVRLRDLQYEAVYRLTEEYLRPLLSTRYHADQLDYLDVFSLLRSFSSGVNRDEWELDIPLRQELVYHVKGDKDQKRLKINVLVNQDNRTGWFVNIDFVAVSLRIRGMKTSDERLDAFADMLARYDEFQHQGLRRLLTDEMADQVEEASL